MPIEDSLRNAAGQPEATDTIGYLIEVEALAYKLAAQPTMSPADAAALWEAVCNDAEVLNASRERAIAETHRGEK